MVASKPTRSLSGPRFFLLVGFLFVIHLGFLFLLNPIDRFASQKQLVSHVALHPTATHPSILAKEPALLSTVHPLGFSAGSWLRKIPQVEQTADWNEPDAYLTNSPSLLTDPFSSYLDAKKVAHLDISRARLTVTDTPELEPPRPTREQIDSQFSLTGAIAARRLVRPPTITNLAHTNILKPSHIRIGVDARGSVTTRQLLESSGWPVADQTALQIARGLRFSETETTDASDLDWGQFSLYWVTETPAPRLPTPNPNNGSLTPEE